jgi:hypothetical protein
MRRVARLLMLAALGVAVAPHAARASSIGADGQLVWDPNAVFSLGFESLSEAQADGASWTAWGTTKSGYPILVPTAVSAATWAPSLVTGSQALEGGSALRVSAGASMALAILDGTLFESLMTQRIVVSMWGRAYGAEPELDVVFPSTVQAVGPDGFGHIIAIRTGNETSDGWAEYSTGPIDGSLFGNDPIGAIILTGLVTTAGDDLDSDTVPFDSVELAPGSGVVPGDATAAAVIDAIEITPAPGPLVGGPSCTVATLASACGAGGECEAGHCVDGAIVWGVVPQASADRTELAQRVEMEVTRLQGAREAAALATSHFSSATVAAATAATEPRAFYGYLSAAVSGLANGHTHLGFPLASEATIFYPYIDPWGNPWSSYMDLCLGFASNDVSGGPAAPAYAVYWIAPGSALATTLHVGDMLTAVDGMSPDAWFSSVETRYRSALPDDPTSEPTGRALMFSDMLAHFAASATFSSCTAAGSCTSIPVTPAALSYEFLSGTGDVGASTIFSRRCSPRFVDAVSTWTPADDAAASDTPRVESANGVASVEFDGFLPAYDSTQPSAPYHAWTAPFTTAFGAGTGVLIDARQGHGGYFVLGSWLGEQIRGTSDPYFDFNAPRGAYDLADPSWLFDPSLAACLSVSASSATMCGWVTGLDSDASTLASPPGGTQKIAWLNANDLSMSDITPGKLKGDPLVQMFGPHPTTGAFGDITFLPPIVASWGAGSIQATDVRYGSSFTTAASASWASGHGVAPDVVVTQKVSDLLAGKDTVLEAAKAWLAQ